MSIKQLLFFLGIFLSVIFGLLTPKVHNYSHDGRQLYVGARLIFSGKNPYARQEMKRGYEEYTREPSGVLPTPGPQLHLPATFILLVPFALLPWPLFCWLQIIANAFCLPVIAYVCLRQHFAQPPVPLLLGSVFFLAILPGTWQNFALGQIALPIMALTLGSLYLLKKHSTWLSLSGIMVSLAKFTLCLPLFFFSFWTGRRADRLVLLAGLTGYLLLNLAGALVIGPRQCISSYAQNNSASFATGSENAAQGQTVQPRVDLEILLAAFCSPAVAGIFKDALVGLLFASLVWKRPKVETTLVELSALSLLALLLFYHRTYDTVLLAPSLVLVLVFWTNREMTGFRFLFAGLLALTLASIGSEKHNLVDVLLHPLHLHQPSYWKALCLLLDTLVLIYGVRQQAYEPGHSQRPTPHPAPAGA